MKILNEKPPIWDEAHKHFTIDDDRVLFTYGDTLYNPSGRAIDESFIAHEEVHAKQQTAYEGGAEAWWKRYFIDTAFRLTQEAQAYARQYAYICHKYSSHADWIVRMKYLERISEDFSGATYNLGITEKEAKTIILNYSYGN
jgi:hypothetical protein